MSDVKGVKFRQFPMVPQFAMVTWFKKKKKKRKSQTGLIRRQSNRSEVSAGLMIRIKVYCTRQWPSWL